MAKPVTLKVNGREFRIVTATDRTLLSVLREELGLTGTKYGCGEGQCGACTVLVDGKPVRSCVTPVSQVGERSIVTIEGLAGDQGLHPVQEAFLREGALQCGYCTPGMILAATALLERDDRPTREEIIDQMNGHICRCNGYAKIVRAIQRAAASMKA